MTEFVEQNAGEQDDGIENDGPGFPAGCQEGNPLQVAMNVALGEHEDGQR